MWVHIRLKSRRCIEGQIHKVTASEIIAELRSCRTQRDLERVNHAQSTAVQNCEDSDTFVANSLVSAFARCGSMIDSRRVFNRIDPASRTVFSWNFLIRGYVENDQAATALELFDHMDCQPNPQSFVAALKACSKLASQEDGPLKVESLERGRNVAASAVSSGNFTSYVADKVVDVFIKCGSLKKAKKLFDKLPQRSVVTYTTLMQGYVQHGEPEIALDLFEEASENENLDGYFFLAALKACCSIAEKEKTEGKPLNSKCLQRGLRVQTRAEQANSMDSFVANEMIDLYAKCGRLEEAQRMFDGLRGPRDVLSWNTLMLGYTENNRGKEALEVYSRMSCERNAHTYVAALKACSSKASLSAGKMIHEEICRGGVPETDLVVSSALIDFYGKCRSITSAQNVFDSAGAKNLLTWTTLMAGYSLEGDSDMVFSLFRELLEEGWRPDVVTFVCLLSACNNAGLVGQGWKVFNSMQDEEYGIRPVIEHYTCIVELLARSNWLHDALALMREMEERGLKPGKEMWKSLLRYSRKWENFEVGRVAFESLVKLDDKDMNTYLMMTKLHGSQSMWSDHGFEI